jgi:glycosyltransferase involved in cell wall biosynthesis
MAGKIRVLYLIGTLDIGGAEGQLVQLAMRLDRSRFETRVCALASGGPHQAGLNAAGVPVDVIGFRGLSRRPQTLVPLARFFATVRRWRPTLVHGFLFWAYVPGAIVARAARVPVVVTSRRSLGHFRRSKPYCDYLFLERAANRVTDLVIANSEAVRDDTLRGEGLAPDRVAVIHNGLDADRYQVTPDGELRRSLGLADGAPVVTVIANFIAYKAHGVFLAAWRDVVRRVPGAVALLIGAGPLRAELEGRAATLGVTGSLRFLGTRRDVPALLALTDVFVHPSLEEGFSNAILEAMAAGKPVVATAVGGNPEAVSHEETGLVVPPGDAASLATAIVSLLDDPAAARKLGAAGRRRVAERFTVDRMVHEYEAVYEKLVASARPGLLKRRVTEQACAGSRGDSTS